MLRVVDPSRGDALPIAVGFALDRRVSDGVKEICDRVRDEGDAALIDITRSHDGADVTGRLRVSDEEIESVIVEDDLWNALDAMAERLRDLHARQRFDSWEQERHGVVFGELVRAIGSVGCYVPGGRAAYPSSVLMTVIPAKVAGVERVAVCSPPTADGSLPAAVLAAVRIAGADEVYRVGGAQAIAALAFGTETISPVDKIVGPGGTWVTAAKREVAGTVGIDGLAGPSELVIVADESARPDVLACDLLAQAEHDPAARAILVAIGDGESMAHRVDERLREELERSPRREVAGEALASAFVVVVPDEAGAVAIVDRLAPEHLQVVTQDPRGFLKRARAFGAAFLGPHTPVAFGDYGIGSNHVLPTMATARFGSGLRTADFTITSSFVQASAEAVSRFGPEVELVAASEGLPGHARTVQLRR
ncbi:MAG: histidinol dehydrogenase [Actinomycetota bacterium]